MDDPEDIVDIEGVEAADLGSRPRSQRRWLGVLFRCCQVYDRVYRAPDQPSYRGQCPKCGRELVIRVGPQGTSSRFFTAE